MTSMTPHQTAMQALEECMTELHAAAAAVVFDHWEKIKAHESRTTGYDDRSNIGPAAHRQGNHIQAKWIAINWYGKGAARRQVKVNIPRSRVELTYSMAKLVPYAKEWELPIIEETERKLTFIRKQAHHVVRAIMAMKNAALIGRNQPILEEEPTPDDGDE